MFKRSRPKPEWREKNWTSNVFRVLELIFGKKTDLIIDEKEKRYVERIKIESAGFACVDKYGHRTEYVIAYSLEAKIAFFEQYIRKYISSTLRKLKQFRLPEFKIFDSFIPEYALAGISYIPKTENRPSGYMFAIALDTSASGVASATTVTLTSYTVTGSNTIMLASAPNQSNAGSTNWATDVSGITCNAGAQALSKINVANGDATSPGYGQNVSLWSRVAPSSGAIQATRSTNTDGFMVCVETLSGVDQTLTGSSIANSVKSNGATSGTNTSNSVTCPTNGWTAMGVYIATGSSATATGGSTLRQSASAFGYLFDSTSTVSGSQTLSFSHNTGQSYGLVICAVGPVAVAGSNTTNFFMLKMR